MAGTLAGGSLSGEFSHALGTHVAIVARSRPIGALEFGGRNSLCRRSFEFRDSRREFRLVTLARNVPPIDVSVRKVGRPTRYLVENLRRDAAAEFAALERRALSHAHLPVEHLIRQAELSRQRREQRDVRPAWLVAFIHGAAELFEPFSEVGRVGFSCVPDEQRWLVSLFLGEVETVGGRFDGGTRHHGFQLQLDRLAQQFTRVDQIRWEVYGDAEEGSERGSNGSCVVVDGVVDSHALRLQLFSRPPPEVGPALRKLPGGRFETV